MSHRFVCAICEEGYTYSGFSNYCSRRCYNVSEYRSWRACVIAKFGNRCKKCGFDDPRALQIEHTNGDGYIERRNGYTSGVTYFKKVLADESGRYQLLCANCNWIKKAEWEDKMHRARRWKEKIESINWTTPHPL
jgi:hypothetical protein